MTEQEYLQKAETALLAAEEKINSGESGKELIELASKWKELAHANKSSSTMPPFVQSKLPDPRQSFHGGQYL